MAIVQELPVFEQFDLGLSQCELVQFKLRFGNNLSVFIQRTMDIAVALAQPKNKFLENK